MFQKRSFYAQGTTSPAGAMKCSWLHLALASAYALSCRVNGESSTNYNSDYYEAYASYSAGDTRLHLCPARALLCLLRACDSKPCVLSDLVKA